MDSVATPTATSGPALQTGYSASPQKANCLEEYSSPKPVAQIAASAAPKATSSISQETRLSTQSNWPQKALNTVDPE